MPKRVQAVNERRKLIWNSAVTSGLFSNSQLTITDNGHTQDPSATMTAAFYSRYVPPARGPTGPPIISIPDPPTEKKRKRDTRGNDDWEVDQLSKRARKSAGKEVSRKSGRLHDQDNEVEISERLRTIDGHTSQADNGGSPMHGRTSIMQDSSPGSGKAPSAEDLLSKYSVTGKIRTSRTSGPPPTEQERGKAEGASARATHEDVEHVLHTESTGRKGKNRARGIKDQVDQDPSSGLNDARPQEGHQKIRARYERTAKAWGLNAAEDRDRAVEDNDSAVVISQPVQGIEKHGLEPLPQPSPVPESKEKPSYSALPPWLTKPISIKSTKTVPFSDLGLSSKLQANLQAKGYVVAFPIQASVVALLLQHRSLPRNDICISAATGSGKTLAYVLPMIEGLKDRTVVRLRGIIVVPTRELVQQARETCEMCSEGTGLRIGTCVGSRNLKEEQKLLVKRTQRYDPQKHGAELERPMTSATWAKFDLPNLMEEVEDDFELRQGYTPQFQSEVDILICTPGRLVDHLKSTRGFTLRDIEWLVVDEADRLLNESFQEWVKVVIPAIEADSSYEELPLDQKVLVDMRFDKPPKELRKIILSATMTQDLTKLTSLRLRNPKMLIVGDDPKLTAENEDGGQDTLGAQDVGADGVELPKTLREMAVPIKEEGDKPLYLLEMLRSHIMTGSNAAQRTGRGISPVSDTSSAESSDEVDTASTTESENSEAGRNAQVSGNSMAPESRAAKNSVLVFTKSTESASRLSRLLSLLEPAFSPLIGTLTKSTTSSTSRRTLALFRQHKLSILVATDRASRGLDIPELGHVISYDMPASVTSYIHRVGRTARAGKEGTAWTMVAHREGKWFWNEIGKGTGESRIRRAEKVGRYTLGLDMDPMLRARYESALSTLGEEVRMRQ